MQLAKVLGAHVTAVVDTKHVDLARDLGADEVIDRLTTDFTRLGRRWDAIIDSVGKLSFSRCRGSLAARGTYLSSDLGPLWQNPVLALVSPRAGGRHMHFPIPHYRKSDVEWLRDLLERGEYRAVIDRRYRPDDILEATRYVETPPEDGQRGDPGDRSGRGRLPRMPRAPLPETVAGGPVSRQRLGQGRAQDREIRGPTGPELEADRRLPDEHLVAVDRHEAAPRRIGEERRRGAAR